MDSLLAIASVAVLLVALVAWALDKDRYGGYAFGLASVWFAYVAITGDGLLVWLAAAVAVANAARAIHWFRTRRPSPAEEPAA